jgi:hypothetical protein
MGTFSGRGSLIPETSFLRPLSEVRGNAAAEAARDEAFATGRIAVLTREQNAPQAPEFVMGALLPRTEARPLRERPEHDTETTMRKPDRKNIPDRNVRLVALREAIAGDGATTFELAERFPCYAGPANSVGKAMLLKDLKAVGARQKQRGAPWCIAAEPSRAEPSRAEPSRAEPEPSRAEPSRAEPSRAEPSPPVEPSASRRAPTARSALPNPATLPTAYLALCVAEARARARELEALRGELSKVTPF